MAESWKSIDGKWYYLAESSDNLSNTVTLDGNKANADGVVLYDRSK